MSDWTATLGRERRITEALGWLVAVMLAFTAHAGTGWWLTRVNETAGIEMVYEVDLAPVLTAAPMPPPVAPPDTPMLAAPDMEPVPEDDKPAEEVPVAEQAVPDFEQPEQLVEQQPDDLPRIEAPPEPMPEPPPVVENAEAVLAPEASLRPPPRPKKQKKVARAEPAPRTAAAPEVKAPKAETPAAQARGNVTKQQTLTWQQKVNRKVASHMVRWSNRLRQEMQLAVVITIDGSGRVGGVSIVGSTGDARSDASLRSHAARLTSLPAPPDGQPHKLKVPVRLKPH